MPTPIKLENYLDLQPPPTSEADRLAAKAYELLTASPWNYSRSKVNHVSNTTMGYLEHLIHEMAHAASLRIAFDHEAPRKIGTHLIGGGAYAINEEARALAVGFLVWKELDMPFGQAELDNLASHQEVPKRILRMMFDLPEIEMLSKRLVDFLRLWSWNPYQIADDWRLIVGRPS